MLLYLRDRPPSRYLFHPLVFFFYYYLFKCPLSFNFHIFYFLTAYHHIHQVKSFNTVAMDDIIVLE